MILVQQPNESFDKKYRPQSWNELIGQEETVASLRNILDHGGKRCFLFHGPTGVGKTTAARLTARHLGCFDAPQQEYYEHDAGQFTGIEHIRKRIECMPYKPMIRGAKKVICVDEFHRLSKDAMQCLLKPIEEPPPYGFWIFCTTDIDKIPPPIVERCADYEFLPVAAEYIVPLLLLVNRNEGLNLERDALRYIAEIANGCPRRALRDMEKCRHLRTFQEVHNLLPFPETKPHGRILTRRRFGQGGPQ